MGTSVSKLFHDKPFPVNAGATQVLRTIERNKPAYGPSKMPHVPVPPPYPARDAMGRTVVEDGDQRLRVGWPQTHAEVCSTVVIADFVFGILLWNTDKLNELMKQQKFLALCVIDKKTVVMLYNVPYAKACEEHPDKQHTAEGAAARLPLSQHRLSAAQLHEVIMRLKYAYLEYGVGALIMEENSFSYQVMVPCAKEYLLHKEEYDGRETVVRAEVDERHARSKRTRSGAGFDADGKKQK